MTYAPALLSRVVRPAVTFVALCAGLGFSALARADTFRTLSASGVFQSGSTLSGTVTINETPFTEYVSGVNLTTTGSNTYAFDKVSFFGYGGNGEYLLTAATTNATPATSLFLWLPTGSGFAGYTGGPLSATSPYTSALNYVTSANPYGVSDRLLSGFLGMKEQPVFSFAANAVTGDRSGLSILATAKSSVTGVTIPLDIAAKELGFDSFNWMQVITSDTGLAACAGKTFTGTRCDAWINPTTGIVAPVGTPDAPLGGWQYLANSPGRGSGFPNPTGDFYPTFYDEYFPTGRPGLPLDRAEYQDYQLTTDSPPQSWPDPNLVASSISDAKGMYFIDRPDTNGEKVYFVDLFVGVKGDCSSSLYSLSCSIKSIDGGDFFWSSINSRVSGPFRDDISSENNLALAPLLPLGCNLVVCGESISMPAALSLIGARSTDLTLFGQDDLPNIVSEPDSYLITLTLVVMYACLVKYVKRVRL